MTGNIVFVGIAAGTTNLSLTIFCGAAIAGYMVGVLAGSRLAHVWDGERSDAVWPSRVTQTLGIPWGVLIAVCAARAGVGGAAGEAVLVLFLVLTTAGMGLQSAAIRAIGVSVSTTYMTGALTAVLETIATRRPFTVAQSSSLGGLVALALGALLGALAITTLRPAAFVVPVVALGVVLGILVTRRGAGSKVLRSH